MQLNFILRNQIYLFYLAYKMFGSLNVKTNEDKLSGRPMKMHESILFQYLNPKAWVASMTAVTVFFFQIKKI